MRIVTGAKMQWISARLSDRNVSRSNRLLVRTIAGKARVSFLSVSELGFVEMFVGVGATRVRDLFEKALSMSSGSSKTTSASRRRRQ